MSPPRISDERWEKHRKRAQAWLSRSGVPPGIDYEDVVSEMVLSQIQRDLRSPDGEARKYSRAVDRWLAVDAFRKLGRLNESGKDRSVLPREMTRFADTPEENLIAIESIAEYDTIHTPLEPVLNDRHAPVRVPRRSKKVRACDLLRAGEPVSTPGMFFARFG